MTSRVACAVLAAGASRRLGHAKQLAQYRGEPLVRLAAECSRASRATIAAVIVGAHAESVCAALSGSPVDVVFNPDWDHGMATSIRAATTWAERHDSDALLLTLCDQPLLSTAHLDRVITQFNRYGLPVASYYGRRNAVPALFPRSMFASLTKLRGDAGARHLLNDGRAVQRISWPDGEFDVDNLESERRLGQ